MNRKKCLKCGHDAPFEVQPPEACPSCGAIYAKVEAAVAAGVVVRQRVSPPPDVTYPSAAEAPADGAGKAAEGDVRQRASVPPDVVYPWAAETRAAGAGEEPAGGDVRAFVATMRAESLYPTWRTMVSLMTWLGYLAAVVTLVVTGATAKGSGFQVLIGAGAAAAIAIFATLGKEFWLMMADLSDAAVRMAAVQERRGDEDQ